MEGGLADVCAAIRASLSRKLIRGSVNINSMEKKTYILYTLYRTSSGKTKISTWPDIDWSICKDKLQETQSLEAIKSNIL